MASLAAQTVKPRLLIIDGASTDETQLLAGTWAQKLDGRSLSEPDLGPYDAMNKALAMLPDDAAVWFVNAGDTLNRDDAVALGQSHISVEDFVWGYGPYAVIEQDGSTRGIVDPGPYTTHMHAYSRHTICHQSTICRTGSLRAIGGFDLNYAIAADWKALLQLGLRHPPVTWHEVLVTYRAGGISDRALHLTIREQSRARRELLSLSSSGRLLDALHDANRYLRMGAGWTLERLAAAGFVPTDWRARRLSRSNAEAGVRTSDQPR